MRLDVNRAFWRIVVFHGGFVILYASAVVFSDMLMAESSFDIAPIWPPAGIAMACLLLGGLRSWPTVAAGVLLGQLFSVSLSPIFHVFAFLANVVGPVVAVWVLRRYWSDNLMPIRMRNGMIMLVGGFVLSAIAATLGVMGLYLADMAAGPQLLIVWGQWFLGDAFGVVICTPALLAIGRALQLGDRLADDPAQNRPLEKAIWFIGIVGSVFLWIWLSNQSPVYTLAITFLPLLFLGWSALRFDHLFTSLAVMVITLTVVAFVSLGLAGFVAPQSAVEGLILLLFLSTMGILPLMVSAAAHQNRYLAEELRFRANHDGLTGLPNRNAFEETIRQVVEEVREGGESGAFCYLDLDNFKMVNDSCGHTAGDELLRQIATVLSGALTTGEYLARLGGDEFGVIFVNCEIEFANQRSERLVSIINDFRFVWKRHIFTVSASGGLTPITSTSGNHARVMANADAACYDAKELGGNRVMRGSRVAGDSGPQSTNSSAMQWAVRISDALESNRFVLHAQEIVPLVDDPDARAHFEVLVRLSDQDQKILMPTTFIPAAERFKLMPRLDRWVVRNTLDMLARHPDLIRHIETCSINISGPSLGDERFLPFILEALASSPVPASRICFEITETAAVADLGHAIKMIDTLRDLGCRFALDDFGSGLSSFGYLRALKVDYLKIDGTFIRDLVDNPVDLAMVRSINEVGQVMGKQTIAEFVLNEDIANVLRRIGVNFGQGHAFSKAIPMTQFLETRVRPAMEAYDRVIN